MMNASTIGESRRRPWHEGGATDSPEGAAELADDAPGVNPSEAAGEASLSFPIECTALIPPTFAFQDQITEL
jgi:hypothetical protein